jgi:chloride channel protein, CIC family
MLRLRRIVRNDQLILSVLALVVGVVGGGAVIGFREGIDLIQGLAFGSDSKELFFHAQTLPWWHLLMIPTLGGFLVGLLVHFLMPGRRPHGVSDVIEASALRAGRMSARTGMSAALISAVSIGAGASVGREGPAIHLVASIGSSISRKLHLTRSLTRTLLGCGVAAAVAGSFNAPIAGALFAGEVVIGHYALKSFAPVVMASVAGTAVSRSYYGDFPAFLISEHNISSFWELLSFSGLGVVAGIAAIFFLRAIIVANNASQKIPAPVYIRTTVGGLIVGLIAIAFPHVLGVGYGVNDAALAVSFSLGLLIAIAIMKIIATAVSIGFGFGGGVFSPSLVIGATIGGAYGVLAGQLLPGFTTDPAAYSLVGMGAITAAVLGAPLSTTLIIFEMTGDYALTLAVMVAVVISSVIAQQFHGRTVFSWQLESRGLNLSEGMETALLQALTVAGVMSQESERAMPSTGLQNLRGLLQNSTHGRVFVVQETGELVGTVTLAGMSEVAFDHGVDDLICAGDVADLHPPVLAQNEDLEATLKMMRDTGEEHIAVVENLGSMKFLGCVHERDVMSAYNTVLLESRREERGD